MYLKIILLSICLLQLSLLEAQEDSIPKGFGYIHEEIPSIRYEIRYASNNNFIGTTIDGYINEVAILSNEALKGLSNVQKELESLGLGIKVFDAYRPQRAVNHFVRWARIPNDTLMKSIYYPDVPKNELFKRGYIASKSGHTRGSTVDLSFIHLDTQEELDVGGPFDFFGKLSHHDYKNITTEQRSNRAFMKAIMSKHGFRSYSEEWWHYTLRGEPYPDTYFDFVVK